MIDRHLDELEINGTSVCSGRCYFCSRAHGSGNAPFMSEDVFDTLIRQLQGVQIRNIQTSGCGDCFLHPRFIHFLRTLRHTFTQSFIENYSNFVTYTPQMSELIHGDGLLNRQHVTLHSLNPSLFRRVTAMNPDIVLRNLDYWIDRNNTIDLVIHYANIPRYHQRCVETLGHWPMHSPFSQLEIDQIPDEFEAIQKRFQHGPAQDRLHFERTNFSLWAEREHPDTAPDCSAPCPKLEFLRGVMWVCPDGSLNACGQDDLQSPLNYGNILEADAWELWTGPARRQILERIERREIKSYPCCNPHCCEMRG